MNTINIAEMQAKITLKSYGEVYDNRTSSLNGTRISECQAMTSVTGHSRQKLSNNSEKDKCI